MDELVFALLAVLGYPFLAAWLAGLGKERRISDLELQLEAVNERVLRLASPPPATPEPRPAYVPVKAPPPDIVKPPPPAPRAQDRPETLAPRPSPVKPERVPAPSFAAEAEAEADADAANAGPGHHDLAPDPYLERPTPRWLVVSRSWLLTGNLVAKLGLVILFIGIGFLLKYAAATITIPIELRLAAVVLADLGLLAWGWRLRLARRQIALPIQGTAIAILVLVIFSAYQVYALIPADFAFALLVCLTAFTCLLAVLQEAPWLAAFGITGGLRIAGAVGER